MKIARDVIYVGVNDHQVDLFEGMYKVPNGMSYNSYVILDEKIAVMDTVDKHFTEQWLGNLEQLCRAKLPTTWLFNIWSRITRQVSPHLPKSIRKRL